MKCCNFNWNDCKTLGVIKVPYDTVELEKLREFGSISCEWWMNDTCTVWDGILEFEDFLLKSFTKKILWLALKFYVIKYSVRILKQQKSI